VTGVGGYVAIFGGLVALLGTGRLWFAGRWTKIDGALTLIGFLITAPSSVYWYYDNTQEVMNQKQDTTINKIDDLKQELGDVEQRLRAHIVGGLGRPSETGRPKPTVDGPTVEGPSVAQGLNLPSSTSFGGDGGWGSQSSASRLDVQPHKNATSTPVSPRYSGTGGQQFAASRFWALVAEPSNSESQKVIKVLISAHDLRHENVLKSNLAKVASGYGFLFREFRSAPDLRPPEIAYTLTIGTNFKNGGLEQPHCIVPMAFSLQYELRDMKHQAGTSATKIITKDGCMSSGGPKLDETSARDDALIIAAVRDLAGQIFDSNMTKLAVR